MRTPAVKGVQWVILVICTLLGILMLTLLTSFESVRVFTLGTFLDSDTPTVISAANFSDYHTTKSSNDVIPKILLYDSDSLYKQHTVSNVDGKNFGRSFNYPYNPFKERKFSEEYLRNETFTVVIETYQRVQTLLNLIKSLNGLPHLDKVLVIWNDLSLPSSSLAWPVLHVPLQVISMKENTLRNKYRPYNLIETEGMLLIDDDLVVKHEDILPGFRLWQKDRGNQIGYYGRSVPYNATGKEYLYKFNTRIKNAPKLVMTNFCFLSKYYFYLYTYEMPEAIRRRVDEVLNCDDLAMSFLVAHVIQKPPVMAWKNQSHAIMVRGSTNHQAHKTGFKGLSSNLKALNNRQDCVNYFAQVYGYMPLLPTEWH